VIIKKILTSICLLASINFAHAQTDIDLDALVDGDAKNAKEFANNAFKSTRVVNGHSMEMLGKGVLDTRILHRFGVVNGGFKDLFGLDQASMRLGFDYGVSKNLTIGIGRSTFKKEIDGFVKYRIAHQHTGAKAIPLSIIYVGGFTAITASLGPDSLNTFSNKLGYYHSVILGRKFSTNLSGQISPTIVHTNIVELSTDKNDQIALGIGARYKFTKRVAFVLDTYPILSGRSTNKTPISVGFDIETGGHVFQLHFSNATGMNERAFITETTNNWGNAQFRFGFNLSRVFTVVKNSASSW
jgi:Membrane bound beta barrel domain (DUF5777)